MMDEGPLKLAQVSGDWDGGGGGGNEGIWGLPHPYPDDPGIEGRGWGLR